MPATVVEALIREGMVEPEWQKREEEPRGWRSLTDPEGWRDKAKTEEWSPEVQDGRSQTKAEPEGRGSPEELVDCQATVEKRELGAMVEPTGQRPEVEAESRETPTTLEDGSPAKLPPHRWWGLRVNRGAARRQRGRRQERVEGRAFVSLRASRAELRNGSGHWRVL